MDEDFQKTQSELKDYLECDLETNFKSPWQQFLPENLIFEIFWFLDVKDLISASKTCRTWWRIAQDDFLWKDLLCKKCNLSHKVFPKDNESWKNEYKRIFYNSSFVANETLTQHNDEVYHVSFSGSGRMLSTVGRDGSVKIWKMGNPTTLYGSLDLKLKSESDYTRFSEFNESETMIMVACLVGNGFWSREGLIIVASVKSNPEILYAVHTDFCNFRGSWLDDRSFLSATIVHSFQDFRDIFYLKKYEVPSSCKPVNLKHKSYEDILNKFEDKGNTVLKLTQNASGSHDYVRVIDCKKLLNLASGLSSGNLYPCQHKHSNEVDENCKSGSEECLSSANTENPLLNDKYEKIVMIAQDCYDLPVFERGGSDIMFYGLPSDIEEDEDNSPSDTEYSDDEDTDLVQKERKNVNCKAIHKICCEGGLIGVALSPDQRYLAYNYRRFQKDEDGEPMPSFSVNMEIKIFDLLLGQDTGTCYTGHKAEHNHLALSYIFPSVSTDYVASGSETASAHVWERHYGYCVGVLEHSVKPNAIGVNSVAFSPTDQEVLVSTGDDNKVKIWRSKRRMKELTDVNQGLTDEMATCSKFVEDPILSTGSKTKERKDKSVTEKRNVKEGRDLHVGCCFFHKKSKGKE